MKTFVTGVAEEPFFPEQDLDEDNARLLAVMLADKRILEPYHQMAESVSRLFEVSHPAVRQSVRVVFDDVSREKAASFGAAVYEVISGLVIPRQRLHDSEHILRVNRFPIEHRDAIGDALVQSYDDFRHSMPNTVDVVESAAEANGTTQSTYAVLGAAVSRLFELQMGTIQ